VLISRIPKKTLVRSMSWVRQLAIAFALMSIIPLLTLTYSLITFVRPSAVTRLNLALVLASCTFLSLAGLLILGGTVKSLSRLSACVKINVPYGRGMIS